MVIKDVLEILLVILNCPERLQADFFQPVLADLEAVPGAFDIGGNVLIVGIVVYPALRSGGILIEFFIGMQVVPVGGGIFGHIISQVEINAVLHAVDALRRIGGTRLVTSVDDDIRQIAAGDHEVELFRNGRIRGMHKGNLDAGSFLCVDEGFILRIGTDAIRAAG